MIRRLMLSGVMTVLCSFGMLGQDTIKLLWTQTPLPSREQVKGIEPCGDGLMMATGNDVYHIRDGAVLPVLEGLQHRAVTDVLYRGTVMDVATSTGGVFRSTDHGLRWTPRPLPGREHHVLRIVSTGTHDVALVSSGSMYQRKGLNAAWSMIRTPDSMPPIRDIVANGPRVIAMADSGAIYVLDRMKSWSRCCRLPITSRALIAARSGSAYAVTDTALYRLPSTPAKQPVVVCRLPQDRWQSISIASGTAMMAGKGRRILKVDLGTGAIQEMPVPGSAEDRIGAIYWNGTTVLAGIDRGNGGLYTMRADAPVWQSIALATTKNADISVSRIVEHDGKVVACMTRNGLFVIDSSLRRAEHRHQGIQGTSIATIHRLGTTRIATSRTTGVYRFDSCGADVERITSKLPVGEGYATIAINGLLYVSVGRVGLWKTSDGGRRWTLCRYPDSSAYIDRMDALGSHIVASARERSWVSTDNGASWSRFIVDGDTSILRWTAEQGETAKWRNGETAKWRNGEMAKWRNGEMASSGRAIGSADGRYSQGSICTPRCGRKLEAHHDAILRRDTTSLWECGCARGYDPARNEGSCAAVEGRRHNMASDRHRACNVCVVHHAGRRRPLRRERQRASDVGIATHAVARHISSLTGLSDESDRRASLATTRNRDYDDSADVVSVLPPPIDNG